MYNERVTSYVTKQHKKSIQKKRILAKLKDKHRKCIIEKQHDDGMHEYRANANEYHKKNSLNSSNNINEDKKQKKKTLF